MITGGALLILFCQIQSLDQVDNFFEVGHEIFAGANLIQMFGVINISATVVKKKKTEY